ncbi:hypothetical protein CC1G_09426 [Coprinopsis cinerea okayama7|uniref:Ras GEF n=1 Tax=Coprinopsis cinerea (strain Okayama-7 / 130 / ATCC MYA-4618 / FGSC 9003) TaxID=240176 RepID=A8NIJ8_COPC7|nr:hypothetical protein CC1G_09426 [Coprinopsis cinerea okayama7\|eukprot:XP_001834012.1 hypothetical protein CC1G_09426 [Coprinopsis cinerea okayama7\
MSTPEEDEARPDTPLASQTTTKVVPAAQEEDADQSYTQHAFALSDVVNEDDTKLEPWPEELAGVDINIAPDGTYIETSSGPAARELKRRYDQRFGVSVNVRSPYAITAFVNQHGKQMFRVGHRELSAPAASAAEVAAEIEERGKTSTDAGQSPRSKRPSRMSVHTIFPPTVFTMGSTIVTQSSVPKKLRKARSISSIDGRGVNELGELSHHTGRAHSQSVTAADMPRYAIPLPSRTVDAFGELMDWPGSSSSISSLSSHASSSEGSAIISQPFGTGVSFESPLKKPVFQFLPPPTRHIRLMQSFESGLTARQDDLQSPPTPPTLAESSETDEVKPASAVRFPDRRYSYLTETTTRPSSTYEPPAEASLLTQYATTVFDVLQTYRGLPNLDKLNFEPEGKTVKISLAEDQSAAPRDDPRFVIWGESVPDWDKDTDSVSRDSFSDASSRPISSISKRRSSRVPKPKASEPPSRRVSTAPGTTEGQRIMIAATIERWIAQLTSDLNYDELLDFFLTYRTYISAVDLGHLLISRFHWALQQPKNPQDAKVRQVVRVRTFVAIRYWLVTFFTVDFIPNRELRVLISNWLNTLIHDPLLKQHSDGLGIVRRLAKVAKECKQAHIRTTGTTPVEKPKSPPKSEKVKNHVLGQKFAEAVLKDEDDSDVDLDFIPEEVADAVSDTPPKDPANAHLAAAQTGAVLSPTRPTSSLPVSSFNILQRIDPNPSTAGSEGDSSHPAPVPLPTHQGALSRAFVKTIGRLGRLKRVLHSRSNTRTGVNLGAFDVDGNTNGYLSARPPPAPLPLSPDSTPSPLPSAPSVLQSVNTSSIAQDAVPSSPPATAIPAPPGLPVIAPLSPLQHPMTPTTPTQASLPRAESGSEPEATPEKPTLHDSPPDYSNVNPSLPTPPPELDDYQSFQSSLTLQNSQSSNKAPSIRSFASSTGSYGEVIAPSIRSYASSTGSFGEILDGNGSIKPTFAKANGPWAFDIVSIDDLDLSDTSSDWHVGGPSVPPGLRKQPRKLPQRKDFEFLPRRSEVSSMGIVSTRDSVASAASGGAIGGPIQTWQLNALLDLLSNDEEDGDVADALRRLEGQINPEKIQENRTKVDGWVKQIQKRMATGDYEDEDYRFPVDSDEEDSADEVEANARRAGGDGYEDDSASQQDIALYSNPPGLEGLGTQMNGSSTLGVPAVSSSSSSSDTGSATRSPAVEDAVPIEILQSRVTAAPVEIQASASNPSIMKPIGSLPNNETLQIHQSFILSFRAPVIAEQFAMIDRELFMGVKFEELVTEEWMATNEVDVYDWSQYLKDRARWKAEHRNADKTTALAAVRARFNLIANFVASEVVLTPPSQRHTVVSKFIRVAWKSYELSNFNSLVAIITGLQSDWVNKVMRKVSWSKVGTFETRVFRNLKTFVSSADGFAHIRRAVESIVDAKPMESSSHASSIISGSTGTEGQQTRSRSGTDSKPPVPTACVPFIGVYLAQLYRLKRLPDLIDPTSPNEIVAMNPITGDFNPPAHPEVFDALAPLPPTMQLEPLVNVHKQRKIAAVIKSLVAGQHMASRVNFEVDKKLFQRCLRLRALEPEVLQKVLAGYSE